MSIDAPMATALLCLLCACSKGIPDRPDAGPYPYTNIQPPPGGVASFTVAPLDISMAGSVTALGHITGGGHVLPTNHAYIYAWDLSGTDSPPSTLVQNVYAPATGAVFFTLENTAPDPTQDDWAIELRATDDFYFYLGHVVTPSAPSIGAIVHAGDLLGQTHPGGTLDFGAFDASKPLTGFVNPARYGYETLNAVTPWDYFVEPMRSQLYAKLWRAPGASAEARIDQDIAGTLAGDWFEQSLPVDSSIVESPAGWAKSVSFALDEYDGVTPRFSLGGWPGITNGGVWAISPGLAHWSDITASSGLQALPLLTLDGQTQTALLMVQMLSAERIEIEVFPGSTAASAPFDSGALYYVR